MSEKRPRPNVIVGSAFGPMIVNVNDYPIAKDIFKYGYHFEEEIHLFLRLIDHLLIRNKPVCIFDVGANIGLHSLAFSSHSPSNVFVKSFEAQRQLFYMLCGTVALNNLFNVECINAAVSDTSCQNLTAHLPDYTKPANFGSFELITPMRSDNQDMPKTNFEVVQTVRLDDFKQPVQFIKMDIEGMEDKALRGAEATINNFRPICVIEIGKTDFEFVLQYFKAKDYMGFHKAADLIAIPKEQHIAIDGLNRFF